MDGSGGNLLLATDILKDRAVSQITRVQYFFNIKRRRLFIISLVSVCVSVYSRVRMKRTNLA
jgi:hypothetical protein